MKLLAITGSYRKGKVIDALVDKVIEGTEANTNISVERIRLIEKEIRTGKVS